MFRHGYVAGASLRWCIQVVGHKIISYFEEQISVLLTIKIMEIYVQKYKHNLPLVSTKTVRSNIATVNRCMKFIQKDLESQSRNTMQ